MNVETRETIETYRDEHRLLRDRVLAIVETANRGNVIEARELVEDFDEEIGPHYRYERESLYPRMTRFLSEDRVEELTDEQADSVRAVRTMKTLLAERPLNQDEVDQLIECQYTLMGHIYDCDVAILMEMLPAEEMSKVATDIERSHEDAVPLLQWAGEIGLPDKQIRR